MAQPQKRKRTMTNDSNSLENFSPVKSEEIYFEDGNIVLLAGNVAFRVYRGQLARQATVFRDMLSVVNQPTNAETFDGCPVVRLSDASADVALLLRAMHDNTRFSSNDVFLSTSVLRMATKYLVEPLRESCIEALAKVYPDTLDQWDRFTGLRLAPLLVVQLVDVDILLPATLYHLCSLSLNGLGNKRKLPLHLLEVYYTGKEKITTGLTKFVRDYIVEDSRPPCGFYGECTDEWDALEMTVMRHFKDSVYITHPDPLACLQELLEQEPFADMCEDCQLMVEQAVRKTRWEIWESLPQTFGLGSWKKLREK